MTSVTSSTDVFEIKEPPGRAGLLQAVRAEWTKFWSVRSTPWSLFALIVATIGLALLSTNALHGQPFTNPDPTRRILVGFGPLSRPCPDDRPSWVPRRSLWAWWACSSGNSSPS